MSRCHYFGLSILVFLCGVILNSPNVFALEVLNTYPCEREMKVAQKCTADADCHVVFGVSCSPCECYTAYHHDADLKPIKRLSQGKHKNIICETCSSEKPKAVCRNQTCEVEYEASQHSDIPEHYQRLKVSLGALAITPTRRLRYSFVFKNLSADINHSEAEIVFNLYSDPGVDRFIDYVGAQFPESRPGQAISAVGFEKPTRYNLYIWDIDESSQNFVLESDTGDFYWLNESRPYPRIHLQ